MMKMREYILTEREREIARKYLEGTPLDGFRVLKFYAKRAIPQLKKDLALLEKFLEAT